MRVTDKNDLGYLGEDFQYKLIHTFMEEKEFFKDLNNIIDQNMFTDPMLKIFVGVMKEYYEREEAVPSYTMMGIALNQKAHNDIERETFKAILQKIADTPSDGVDYIRTLAEKFFKQQNIIRTANEILKIAGDGDTSKYEKCLELLNDALNQGTREEFGSSVFDDIGETLSDDYRTPIPTGIGKLDEALEGGLFGKGLGESLQKMGNVPESQNDMIFTIICEELGFFGAVSLILLFMLVLWRMMVIANNAPDLFGSLLVIGVMSHIAKDVVLESECLRGVLIRAVRGHDEEIAQRRSEELGATALLGSASGICPRLLSCPLPDRRRSRSCHDGLRSRHRLHPHLQRQCRSKQGRWRIRHVEHHPYGRRLY